MARSIPMSLALMLMLASTPASAQSVAGDHSWRIRTVTVQNSKRSLPSIEVGSHGRFGIGMFGLKSEVPRGRAVTGQELSVPKQRRAGLGFSFKF